MYNFSSKRINSESGLQVISYFQALISQAQRLQIQYTLYMILISVARLYLRINRVMTATNRRKIERDSNITHANRGN